MYSLEHLRADLYMCMHEFAIFVWMLDVKRAYV